MNLSLFSSDGFSSGQMRTKAIILTLHMQMTYRDKTAFEEKTFALNLTTIVAKVLSL